MISCSPPTFEESLRTFGIGMGMMTLGGVASLIAVHGPTEVFAPSFMAAALFVFCGFALACAPGIRMMLDSKISTHSNPPLDD